LTLKFPPFEIKIFLLLFHAVFHEKMNTEETIDQLTTIRAGYDLPYPDLHSFDQLQKEDCKKIFEIARIFRDFGTKTLPLLKDIPIALAFFESSTRTKSSFEWAGKQLGADMISIGSGTSEKKGESVIDVAQTIDSMGAKGIVFRTSYSGLPQQVCQYISAGVVNAGDGWHEHPTQALIDGLTLSDEFPDLSKKVITIIGDIKHSRVFGSLVRMLKTFNMEIRVVSPFTLVPEKMESVFGVQHFTNIESALPGSDIVYVLRVQNERGATKNIPSLREYSKMYVLSPERLALAKKEAIVMHPGPIQRDIDISHAVSSAPTSRILTQTQNGLFIRKTILWLITTQKEEKKFARI
jgi:aspartate carbamoyltransferase catalytic subunit